MKQASKLLHIMAWSALLSLFGCKPKNKVTTAPHGPFTVEMTRVRSRSLNMNYGWVWHERIDFAVLHHGKPIAFPDTLQTNTGFRNLWKVYILKDAPRPALIAGSQSLYLITEENGVPNRRVLDEQGTDFASLQLLDRDAGQPEKQYEVYMAANDTTPPVIAGGDYLLINQNTVLNIPELRMCAFNKENLTVDDYYYKNRYGAVAFSPDKKQIAFVGNKNDETDYLKYLYALVVFDYETGARYAVPFDRTATRMENADYIDRAWIETYFEWQQTEAGNYRLQLRRLAQLPYWQGRFDIDAYNGECTSYYLQPVKPEAEQVFADFLRQELALNDADVQRQTQYGLQQHIMHYRGLDYSIWYQPEEKKLSFFKNFSADPGEEASGHIRRVGEAFNEKLGKGEFQALFTAF